MKMNVCQPVRLGLRYRYTYIHIFNYFMNSRLKNNEQSLCYDPWESALVKAKIQEKECDWTGLKFSRDGKTILISIDGRIIRLIDAFHGTPLQTFTGQLNNKGIPIEASLRADSHFVFSGSTDGRVHVWNADTGYKVCILHGDHLTPVQCGQFSPNYMMLASVCTNVAFGLRTVDDVYYMDSSVNNEQSLCYDPWETAFVKANNQEKECDWTGLKFSRDRKTILISTDGRIIRLIDAFHGTPLQRFTGQLNIKGNLVEASFSPDSQFVFSRSTGSRVHVWNADTGSKDCVLNGDHPALVQCGQFNPNSN